MAIRWFNRGNKRYFVVDITGFVIDPQSSRPGDTQTTTYAVCDRDWNCREVAVFTPSSKGGLPTRAYRAAAYKLVRELNAREREDMAASA